MKIILPAGTLIAQPKHNTPDLIFQLQKEMIVDSSDVVKYESYDDFLNGKKSVKVEAGK